MKTVESASTKKEEGSAIVKRATQERTAKLVGSWKKTNSQQNFILLNENSRLCSEHIMLIFTSCSHKRVHALALSQNIRNLLRPNGKMHFMK